MGQQEKIEIKAKDLLYELDLKGELAKIQVSHLFLNSKEVLPKSIFFALKGHNFNGNDFNEEALERGAAIILSDEEDKPDKNIIRIKDLRSYMGLVASRFYSFPTDELKTFCVTGTNGKTTCVQSISSLLNSLDKSCGYISTVGISLDGNEILEVPKLTTPQSLSLQKIFFEMLNCSTSHVAFEASSHGLKQSRLQGTNINTAILTSFSQDHLDYHENIDDYGSNKRKLFFEFEPETSILNIDSTLGLDIYEELKGQSKNVFSISLEGGGVADFDIKFERLNECCLEATLKSPFGKGRFVLNSVSRFLAFDVLCSVSALLCEGYDIKILESISNNIKFPDGRMNFITIDENNKCFVDFAHTPEALETSLKEINSAFQGKIWCLFGCGGDRDKIKRPIMGKIAEDLSYKVVITNDNPRFENEDQIITEIISGMSNPNSVDIIKDREKAILFCLKKMTSSKTNNILLIAGKGHEKYQQVGKTTSAFSDAKVVESFKALRYE